MRPDAEDVLIPEGPYDLRSTVFGFTWNPTDPCRWMRQGVFAMADRWPAGPATWPCAGGRRRARPRLGRR